MISAIVSYIVRVITAFSIFLNVLVLGKSNQTFSARNHIWSMKGYPNIAWLIDSVFYFDLNHSKRAYIYWVEIKNALDAARKKEEEAHGTTNK